MSTIAALRDIANARARALNAVKAACGTSIDAQFYAKRILDRYELVMQEHGFGYQVLVDNTELLHRPDDEAGWSEPVPFQQLAGFLAAFSRSRAPFMERRISRTAFRKESARCRPGASSSRGVDQRHAGIVEQRHPRAGKN